MDTFKKSLADVRSAWRDGRSAALVVLYNVCVGGRWRSRRGLQPIHWIRLWDAWAAAFNKWILARTQDYGGVQKWNYVNTHLSGDVHWIWMHASREVAIDWKIWQILMCYDSAENVQKCTMRLNLSKGSFEIKLDHPRYCTSILFSTSQI